MKTTIYRLYHQEKIWHFDEECEGYMYSEFRETRFSFTKKEDAKELSKLLMQKDPDTIYKVVEEIVHTAWDSLEESFKDPYINRVLEITQS